ncbi:MAG: ABC transporter ATP-binding protein [Candidatus Doudnabacteria bacterium]|nr:ABC transporter ATP-binding protein [Candidatus Doudnabacteria bacterium]
MLKIQNLSKKFGNKTALNNINLEIRPGEVFCLIGPNGAGKSTLVKIAAGLLQPGLGEVLIGGFDIVKTPEKAKALAGYIPDEPTVWSAITGGEFLQIVGALYGVSPKERVERIPKLLSMFGLSGIDQEYFEDYSRGNKQKFSILAALLHRPKILLVDEPIVGLDPTSAETAKFQFAEFAKNGGSVLMVTHTLSVAQAIATRVGFLENGSLKAVGTMAELRRRAGLPEAATLEEIYKKLV